MDTNEAVQEIIDAELTDEQKAKAVALEIASMVTINQTLNGALWKQIKIVDDLRERIARMEQIAAQMALDVAERVPGIIDEFAAEGSHTDRNYAALRGIKMVNKLLRMVWYDKARINDAARGSSGNMPDMDDIPF